MIKMGFNRFLMFVTFQYRGLHHLGMHCSLITDGDLNQTFILIVAIWNYEMHA